MGVGYDFLASMISSNLRLAGRGRPGLEERGSNAGSKEGRRDAGAAAELSCACIAALLLRSGELSIVSSMSRARQDAMQMPVAASTARVE